MSYLRPRFSKFTLAALLLTTAFGAESHAQEGGHLTLQDLLSVEPIGESALSPDGKTIALTRSGQIALLPSEGGWPVLLTSTQGGKSGLAWSPDGKRIAYASQGSIWVVSASGGAPHRLTNAPAEVIHVRRLTVLRAGRPRADGYSFRVDGAASTVCSL
jgi:WD40 repeat protein